MSNEKQLEKALNLIIRRKYPFIQKVEVEKMKQYGIDLRGDINFFITKDFLKKQVDDNCYDQMGEDIFFTLSSFNECSNIKIDQEEIKKIVDTLYKMMSLNRGSVYFTTLSLSVMVFE